MRRQSLNAVKLEVARTDLTYVAVILDLYKHGVVEKAKAEEILGFDIDDSLPGSSYARIYAEQKKRAAAKPVVKAPEPVKEPEPEPETDEEVADEEVADEERDDNE